MLRTVLKSKLAATVRNYRTTAAVDAKVLCSDPIDSICPEILKANGHSVDVPPGDKPIPAADLKKMIGQYDALIVRSGTKVTADVLDAASRLKFIGRAGSGVDNVDLPAATRRGIVVMNTPGGNTAAAAELTMALILGLSRNIPQACLAMKAGKWDRKKYKGSELSGKVIGIVGLGNIGRQVAKYCQQFGMRTIGYDPILTPAAAEKLGIEMTPLSTLYAQSDFITLHLPLIEQTRHLLNANSLNKCKTGARIINAARGGVVNEKDLLEALNSGQIAGAAIDAFENEPLKDVSAELAAHPNVICTPHIGASTKESQFRVARDIANYLNDALDKRKYFGVVNADSLDMHLRSDLQPWVDLADRVGQLQASLLGQSALEKVIVTFQGAKLSDATVTGTLKSAILRGLFQVINPSVAPNLVNTPVLVKEFGLNVAEQVSPESHKDFDNLVTVEFTTKGGATQKISATLVGNVPKIVAVNDFAVDVCPQGDMLLFTNTDRPGVLKRVTNLLSRSEINIASLSLSRNDDGKALGILNLDNQIPADVLDKLSALDDVQKVVAAQVSPYFVQVEQGTKPQEPHSAVPVTTAQKPREKPNSPNFGSGPTAKPPGWTLAQLGDGALGRSHRSSLGLKKLREAINHTKSLLNVPSDYHVGIVPASDTGAFEMAMWSMLGPRTVDVAFWESFGKGWYGDAKNQLKLNVNAFKADYGVLPKLPTDPENDVLFTWNGTTSGVMVPNADWIAKDRAGLVFCDATSAVFAQDVTISKLDVVTYSWQKVLGGEGAHGMLILSPKAVQRLESYTPTWPMPKIFRMVKDGKLESSIFDGSTINTPSMLCVEDYIVALNWAEKQGGLKGLIDRCNSNLGVIEEFVAQHDWIDFLAKDPATRSNTSVCLSLKLSKEQIKKMTTLLEKEGVAYDIGSYRDAPPGLRIWCGATVEKSDLEALMPWIHWAYNTVVA